MWLELTNRLGKTVLVNMDRVVSIEPDLGGAKLTVDFVLLPVGNGAAAVSPVYIEVKEKLGDIAALL